MAFVAFLTCQVALAQSDTPARSDQVTPEEAEEAEALQIERVQASLQLHEINQALADKRAQLEELQTKLQTAEDIDKAKISERIAELRKSVGELETAFEKIAVSGINLRYLDDAEEPDLDWRDELTQIARPILSSLKEATEKPRKIEELRSAIKLYEQRLEVIDKATESIDLLSQNEMSDAVNRGLRAIATTWFERRKDIELSLDAARNELQNLQGEDVDILETISGVIHDFLVGRGLTLLIAIVTGMVVWYAMRGLRWVVGAWRRSSQDTERSAKFRLVFYAYHFVTIALVALAVLTVFYVRGDILLLSLTIITLAMLTLGTWRFLPGYVQEARLLLNVGAARQGERVIYNGLPFHIASLNLYSELRNPELEGVIRLPLSEIARMTSRPRSNEAWFPCKAGDYLLLPDGAFAQVITQSVEQVKLKVAGSIVQYQSADFLQLSVRNLSQEGFGVIVVFGIDYRHQDISLDKVPERFKQGLTVAFEQAGLKDDLKNLLVDFKEANASSLDYLIYATMEGNCAAQYFTINRLIQQTLVEICNQEAWGIPFAQITVHQG